MCTYILRIAVVVVLFLIIFVDSIYSKTVLVYFYPFLVQRHQTERGIVLCTFKRSLPVLLQTIHQLYNKLLTATDNVERIERMLVSNNTTINYKNYC